MKKNKMEEGPTKLPNEESVQVRGVIAALDSSLKPLQVLRRISSVLALECRPKWLTSMPKRVWRAYGAPTNTKKAQSPPLCLTPYQINALKDLSEGSVERQPSPFVQIEEMKAVLRAERSPFKALVLITLIVDPEYVTHFLLDRAGVTVS